MTSLFDIFNLILLLILLVPLSIFLLWNWQYRHLQNGFRTMRLTIQHWVSGLFFLVLYLTLRRLVLLFGIDYPQTINQIVASALFIYLLFRTWSSLIIFKKIRDGEVVDHPQ